MPLYTFQHRETGEVVDRHDTVANYDELEHQMDIDGFDRVWSVNVISGKSTGLRKLDDGFNDILKDIKKKSGKGCTINTK